MIGHNVGPEIAAGVTLLVLMDELVRKDILRPNDIARILSVADATIAGWGENNVAVKDARAVLNKMRGLGS